jgi:hypothetical protein
VRCAEDGYRKQAYRRRQLPYFTDEEKADFVADEPAAEKYFRPWLGAVEFLNSYQRWVLWLGNCAPQELRAMPKAMQRVEAVREFRLASKSVPTRKLAATPTRFHVEMLPSAGYLLVPRVSSENREYVPMGFVDPTTLTGDTCLVIPGTNAYHFGVLSSEMHMAWVRYIAGRLKSDFRYSSQIVYNNFPWPEAPAEKRRQAVEQAAQAVLNARAKFPDASLADLYDPVAMPPELRVAHTMLDRAVDAAYGKRRFDSDAVRVAYLFDLYNRYTAELLPAPPDKLHRRKRK